MNISLALRKAAILGMLLTFISVLILAGCGGGGGSSSSSVPPATSHVTLTGVVASGAPVANGAGYALDAATGTTIPFSTDANGNYTVTLNGYSGPFLLHLIGINATGSPVNLYSLATTSNSGGTVNITPLSDVVLGYAAGLNTQSLETYCTSNISACPTELNAIYASLSAANTNVVNAISSVLPSTLPNGFNVFTTSFTANNTGVDSVLDQITVTPAPGSGSGNYVIAMVAAPTTPVVTIPTTGTVGTTSSTAISTATVTASVLSQSANLAAVAPEINALITQMNIASTTSGSNAAFSSAIAGLLDITFLSDGLNKTAYLTETGAGNTIPYGTTITGGGIAPYSGAPGGGPNATYDANNCVTSVWVQLSLNGMNTGSIELLDTGFATPTCTGGTWTIAGNQRDLKSKVYAEYVLYELTGHVPFIKPTLALDIPNAQALTYDTVTVSGPGLVTLGAQTTLSPVTLVPTATNLNVSNTIEDSYYGDGGSITSNGNPYTGGIEGTDELNSCAWIGTNPNGWGPSSSGTPCFNGDVVPGSDYTFRFYSGGTGGTLLETDIERLHGSPFTALQNMAAVQQGLYPSVTSVTPACTIIPVTGASVTANWTMTSGAYLNGVFLNLNDINWGTVNNTWNFNLPSNATSATLTVGSMLTGAPRPTNCVVGVFTTNNDTSLVTIKSF